MTITSPTKPYDMLDEDLVKIDAITIMNNDFGDDDLHCPISGIPSDVSAAINDAPGISDGWFQAGVVFAKHMKNEVGDENDIHLLYEPLVRILNLVEISCPRTRRSAFLSWMRFRYPDVIAAVPLQYFLMFIEGAYREHLLGMDLVDPVFPNYSETSKA